MELVMITRVTTVMELFMMKWAMIKMDLINKDTILNQYTTHFTIDQHLQLKIYVS